MQGAQQFATDCTAVTQAFGKWTPRPAAHLRELSDAVTLLLLDPASARSLANVLDADASRQHGQEALQNGLAPEQRLAELGIVRLTPLQAAAVLERRL